MSQIYKAIIVLSVCGILSPALAQQKPADPPAKDDQTKKEDQSKKGQQAVIPAPPAGAKATPKATPPGKRPDSARRLPNGIIAPPDYVKGSVQLRMMYLDKRIFEPDKWWSYEEADPDRPSAFAVEQETKVSLGGRFEPNHGAQIKYHVRAFPNAAAAHRFLADQIASFKASQKAVKLNIKGLKRGDEGIVADNTIFMGGKPQAFQRRSFVRFDRYMVMLDGNSNMRAFGPRPAHGERKWLSEPVYEAVFNAAMTRWANYKTLMPVVK